MALSGKIAVVLEIKSNGNVFYDLWYDEPEQIPSMSPTTIQECELESGYQPGVVAAMYRWKFFYDGKSNEVVTTTDDIDYDKNMISYEIFDGDLKKLYKTLNIRLNVEKQQNSWVVTWTFEFEKLNADVPDPDTLVEVFKKATKDIETHYLKAEAE